jgi:hypothetical protein
MHIAPVLGSISDECTLAWPGRRAGKLDKDGGGDISQDEFIGWWSKLDEETRAEALGTLHETCMQPRSCRSLTAAALPSASALLCVGLPGLAVRYEIVDSNRAVVLPSFLPCFCVGLLLVWVALAFH